MPTANLQYSICTKSDGEVNEYRSIYQITGMTQFDQAIEAREASGMPAIGDGYVAGNSSDPFSRAVSISNVKPESWEQGNREKWTAVVDYSSDEIKQKQTNPDPDPLNKPPVFSFGARRRRLPADIVRDDFAGKQVTNSAGFAFRPEDILVDVARWRMRITVNQATLDPGTINHYTNAVNVNAWCGGISRTWKMEPPEAQVFYVGSNDYYRVTYEFLHNPERWDLKPPDMGQFDQNLQSRKIDGVTVIGAWHELDGAGEFLGAGVPTVKFDGLGGNPDPIEWYFAVDFTALGLPSSIP